MDRCNIDLIVRLPKNIRNIPEVVDFINQAAQEATKGGRRQSLVINMKQALKNQVKKSNDELDDLDDPKEDVKPRSKSVSDTSPDISQSHSKTNIIESKPMETPVAEEPPLLGSMGAGIAVMDEPIAEVNDRRPPARRISFLETKPSGEEVPIILPNSPVMPHINLGRRASLKAGPPPVTRQGSGGNMKTSNSSLHLSGGKSPSRTPSVPPSPLRMTRDIKSASNDELTSPK